jgi:uncharacterized protein (TIGR02147 family)
VVTVTAYNYRLISLFDPFYFIIKVNGLSLNPPVLSEARRQRLMANITDYTDYHLYLQKIYNDKKERNPAFSYEVFARLIQDIPRAFLFNIINGKRKLPLLLCYRFSNALHHTKSEAEYFENMVRYCDWAKNDEERAYYYERMMQGKSATITSAYQLRKDQYEYFSKWYHSAVLGLIALYPFKEDYAQLCQKLFPPITKAQAKKSVLLLERLGLVEKGAGGIYNVTSKKIKAGDDISHAARRRLHFEYCDLAKNSTIKLDPALHDFSSLTLGISERTYEIILKESRVFKDRISELANNEKNADRVYQYQFNFFPLTKK